MKLCSLQAASKISASEQCGTFLLFSGPSYHLCFLFSLTGARTWGNSLLSGIGHDNSGLYAKWLVGNSG